MSALGILPGFDKLWRDVGRDYAHSTLPASGQLPEYLRGDTFVGLNLTLAFANQIQAMLNTCDFIW